MRRDHESERYRRRPAPILCLDPFQLSFLLRATSRPGALNAYKRHACEMHPLWFRATEVLSALRLRLIAKSDSIGNRWCQGGSSGPSIYVILEVMSSSAHWQMDASAPELYERYLVPAITSVWANDLLDRLAPKLDESVLDIACGTGVVARLAEQRGHSGRLVGVDLNTAMLAVARTKSSTIEWIEGSALDLPLDTSSFDVVLCQLGLQFFSDRIAALKEMARVLKSGGRAGLSVYSAIERTPAAHGFVQALDKYLGAESSRTKRSEHLSCRAEEVCLWAKEAGFEVVDVATVTKQINFPSMLDYVRFQLTATPMAALLKDKGATEREQLVVCIADYAASRLEPSMLAGGKLTFPQESFVLTASPR